MATANPARRGGARAEPHRMERYELREKLHASSTATVWRARDRRRRRDVALKVANDGNGEISARRLLEAEAEVAARLDHPNIVAPLATHLDAPRPAIAFPLIEGETLAERLATRQRLLPVEAAAIAADIAAALAHAHSRGVVHRDVKPGNILLAGDGAARLFDFGISGSPERGPGDLVEPGMTTGTLPYMAPEQLSGQPADPATDVYALGAVMYEMLAGRRPYEGASPDAMAAAQQQPPLPLDDVPADLADVALRALDPDPLARPRAGAVATQLRGWLSTADEEETRVVAAAHPMTAVVRSAPAVPRARSTRVPGTVLVAVSLIAIGGVAAALAFAVANSAPPSELSTPSGAPVVGASPLPTLPWPPSPAPTSEAGDDGTGGGRGGGGGGHDDNGRHGDNDKGDKGERGRGKGKGN